MEQLSIRLYVNEEDKMLLEKLLKLQQESILADHLENLKKVMVKMLMWMFVSPYHNSWSF